MSRSRMLAPLILAASLILSACALIGAGQALATAVQAVAGTPASEASGHTARPVGDTVVLRGTQGLIVAHNAYQTAAAVARVYVQSGFASPAQLNRIEALNNRAIQLLEVGDRGLSVAQRAAEVMNIVAELNLFRR